MFSTDLDECTESPDICGLGTCTNNENATFYNCSCQDGAMLTEIGNSGTFTCVGMLLCSLLENVKLICYFCPDIDECSDDPDICGLGSCTNNDNGTFYQCVCQDGAETTGAGPNLTCVGR